MSLKDKEEKENRIEEMKSMIIKQQEELVNLQDGYNRQRITTNNFKDNMKMLEKENETIKNSVKKIQQESITKIDREIQTEEIKEMIIELEVIKKTLPEKGISKGKLIDNDENDEITEDHLKGNDPIMKVYEKKNNKRNKKRKAS